MRVYDDLNHSSRDNLQDTSKPLRIGIDVRPLLQLRTGVERVAINFMRNLVQEGGEHRYTLFADQPSDVLDEFGPPFEQVIVPVRWPKLQRICDYWLIRQVRPAIKQQQLDAFLTFNTKFPFAPVRRFTVVHGLEWRYCPSGYRRSEWVKQWFWFQACTRYSHGLVTFSNTTRDDIQTLGPKCRVPACTVGEGVDPIFRALTDHEREPGVLKEHGIDSPYVLSVCSLEPRKNIDGLLRAFADVVRQRNEPLQLVLVGRPGWRSDNLQRLAHELQLAGRVVFTGYVADEHVVQLMNQAELFVYPSKYEGFGLPVLEAMTCGVPVVTSSISATADVAGDAAELVDPYSSGDIALGITRLIDDKARRAQLISRGRQRAAQFSWSQMTRTMVRFIAEQCGVHERGQGVGHER